MAFCSDMIHLPFGEASPLWMGRLGEEAWWAAKSSFQGLSSQQIPDSAYSRKRAEIGGQDWNEKKKE